MIDDTYVSDLMNIYVELPYAKKEIWSQYWRQQLCIVLKAVCKCLTKGEIDFHMIWSSSLADLIDEKSAIEILIEYDSLMHRWRHVKLIDHVDYVKERSYMATVCLNSHFLKDVDKYIIQKRGAKHV